ncbi:2-iminobutanoate/2-iminopropanoate deaminase [Edaphobacter aggregans]|jgi:2-iminobutanoate/2-iminopropanoate deaminase|uniref:2-iminobutanoate/2-iminopropanoate deaminase n=1 Tax=Edaphobacter aggregans TaxID=570835 RepID=A0A428MGP3_9BACT|nr:Rid family hydrolase [Edaphobacter aggregans]RSL15990.1 2-iminobutanoate/2-iminopropanoate deaminase [Edaphobacter aggregans]
MSNIELATPQYPFSPGLLLGDTLYVSGHLGIDLATGKRPADLESEARVMMDAFQRTIQASHMLMDDLVSVTVYCTDLSAFATFNSIYVQYFQPPYPARAFIGAPRLLLDTHFEIQGIAVKDAHKTKAATPISG